MMKFLLTLSSVAIFIAVVFGSGTTDHAQAVTPADFQSLVVKLVDSDKLYEVPLTNAEDTATVIADLSVDPVIDFVAPNYTYSIVATPNDPQYSNQWYLPQVGAPTAWNTNTGSSSIVVAVLDTGFDTDHPDLQSALWVNTDETSGNGLDDDGNGFIDDRNGWDFVGEVSDPNPKYDSGWTSSGLHHGTAIAGVVGATGNNGQGIAGINWTSSIMPLRVLDSTGLGDTRDVYEGIVYAANNGADIINLSFVGANEDTLLAQAINDATAAGVLVFAAAGNDNINLNATPRYPVCSSNVIGVGGTDANDVKLVLSNGETVTGGSNYGSDCVDISAPSSSFFSTVVYDPGQGLSDYYLGGWSGTSLASPLVAGAAALLMAHDSTLTPQQVAQTLIATADNIDSLNPSFAGQLGSGRLDIADAITSILPSPGNILTGVGNGGGPHVRMINASGIVQSQFFAYAETFRGGVNVAAGDVDGDGVDEIVAGAGFTGGPHVRVFEKNGTLVSQFFAYAETFRGGVYVAVGDTDGDGVDEIVAGAGFTGGPHVRVFDFAGTLQSQFFAYAETFRGGVNVAAGDVDGDGVDEIIAGAGNTGGPHVRVFSQGGVLQSQFFAYAETFRGGVNVAAGDVDGDGVDEIIAGAGFTGGPHVRVFNQSGVLESQFFAFGESFRGGVNVAAGDTNADGVAEIIAGAGETGGPQVRVFSKYGVVQSQFFAYAETFRGGVFVSVIK